MIQSARVNIQANGLADLCMRFSVAELSVFGSALRDDFRPESDLDLLVSFLPGTRVTFLTLARMQRELESLAGRPVDLVPREGLKAAIREDILANAQVHYAV